MPSEEAGCKFCGPSPKFQVQSPRSAERPDVELGTWNFPQSGSGSESGLGIEADLELGTCNLELSPSYG